ncbi:MAG TPA: redoxin domain-containing protein, partial [Parasegetibacter sp.]
MAGQVLIANLYAMDSLSENVNRFAAEEVSKWDISNAKVLDIRASFEARSGQFKKAAETQRKAIEKAKAEKDNPAMTEGLIEEMQKRAEEYEKKAGANTSEINGKITIGDKVPELKYGTWLKGEPIKAYEKGRLYIFEFWATWCGPCIASMPHLSEFAAKHKDDVTVIAVNIWEKTGDQPYETSLPKVKRFVEQMGDKMGFDVITDSKDEFMGTGWMKAAGQNGIPCSFIVKDGIIQWIGHPVNID